MFNPRPCRLFQRLESNRRAWLGFCGAEKQGTKFDVDLIFKSDLVLRFKTIFKWKSQFIKPFLYIIQLILVCHENVQHLSVDLFGLQT